MFSKISKGFGSWQAGYVDPYYGEKRHREHTLPEIDHDAHCHGITVGPHSGRSTAMASHRVSREPTSDSLPLPKTYTTRRGALQLYIAPDDEEESEDEDLEFRKYSQIKRPCGQELIDLSLKLGTMDRLAMSVLQFGDQEYDHDHTSISDAKNKAFLKFLHSIDNVGTKNQKIDNTIQPGGDLNSYLKDLRSSSSMRYFSDGSTYIPKSRESMELQAILRGLDNSWPLSFQQDSFSDRQTPGQFTRPVSRVSSRGPSPGPPSTPRSTYQVLSTKKLAASIKSGSFLGRPSSTFSVADDDTESEMSLPAHTTANVPQRQWSPSNSQDETLLQMRDQFYRGTEEDGEIDDLKKRRRFKERSLLTGSELLYQGRNTYVVDESHVTDVKGTSKGEGHTEGKGHGMLEIVEESGEGKVLGNADSNDELDETESVTWAKNIQRINSGTDHETKVPSGPTINVEIVDEKAERLSSARSRSRPGSSTSLSSQSSKQTPTIISIQVSDPSKPSANKVPDKPFVGLKRRKSLSNTITTINTPDKNRYMYPGYRLKSPKQQQEKISDANVYDTKSVESMPRVSPRSYTFGPGVMNWSIGDGDTAMQDRENITPDNTPDLSHEHVNLADTIAGEVTADSRPDSGHSDANSLHENRNNDNIEQDEFLKEEDILDNIDKCNEEVEQIEAKGEQVEAKEEQVEAKGEQEDDSSDSGTYVDEEDMIKVIREVEKEQGIEHGFEDVISRNSGMIENDAEINRDESRGPEVALVDEVEVEKPGNEDSTVDEVYDETQSSIRSRKSSRLSKTKKTTDGGTEEGSQDDSDEDALPTLLSDQLEMKMEQVSDDTSTFIDDYQPSSEVLADIAPPSDSVVEGQAELVGIVDSSSDKLVSASNSRSVSRHASDSAGSISIELTLNTGISAGNDGDIVDARELQSEVSAPSADVDKTESPSPSANLGSLISVELKRADPSGATDDSQTDSGLKTANQAEPEGTIQEVVDRTDISKEVPKITEEQKVEPETKAEQTTQVKTVVKSAKKERKPPGQITRPGKSTTKPSEQTSEDTVEEKEADVDEADKAEVKQPDKDTAIGKEVEGVKSSESVDQASSIGQSGEGLVTEEENTDIPLQTSTAKEALSITSELDALGLRQPTQTGKKKGKKEKGSKYVPPPPPSKRVEAPKEDAKIPDHLKDLLNRKSTNSVENLEKDLEKRGFLKDGKVTSLVDESLSGPTLEAIGEGLTEEELELAKQILLKKIEDARGKIDGKESKPPTGKKKAAAKAGKKGGKKKKDQEEAKTEEEIERDMIRHKHDIDKQSRDKEAAELQRKIHERKMMLKMQENMADEKQKEIREKMEQLEREADDLQRAEDEARDILADVRRKQREEREARRKADLERKRNEAAERRERERKEMEDKRKKENDMLEKIADAEMRRRLREEEERKAYEAERLAQEKYDEEMREAQRLEEEEEERLKEMERQAEEEAMQRLIEERETAERQRRRLMEEEEALREAEKKKMEIMMEEEKKLEEARLRMESQELAKREMERQRLMELRRLEEEARIKMQEEIEKRRSDALARRDHNLENKVHVDKLRHGQGITRAWTFSYFVHWPRETYERPMGGYDPRKAVIKNPPPKAKADPPPEGAGQPNPEAT